MEQVGIALTKFYWTRSGSAGSTLLLFLQKTLMLIGAGLLFALAIRVVGAVLQAHGQITSALAASSSPERPDLPDAPSSLPTPQQNSQSNIPFQPPPFSRAMTLSDKFKYLAEPAFGPRSLVTDAFSAGIHMTNPPNQYPQEWRGGAEAFGRLYGYSIARNWAQGIGCFSAAVLLHEDPRYRRSGSTFFPTRLGHAFVFTFVDRTDGGHTTVAISNFTGAAAGGFIGNAYLPAGFDNLTHAGQRSTLAFGGIVVQNVLQEFSPELGDERDVPTSDHLYTTWAALQLQPMLLSKGILRTGRTLTVLRRSAQR